MWFYTIKHNNNFFTILIITRDIILLNENLEFIISNENLEFVSQLFVKTKSYFSNSKTYLIIFLTYLTYLLS